MGKLPCPSLIFLFISDRNPTDTCAGQVSVLNAMIYIAVRLITDTPDTTRDKLHLKNVFLYFSW